MTDWPCKDLVFTDSTAQELMALPISTASLSEQSWCSVFPKLSQKALESFHEYRLTHNTLNAQYQEVAFHFAAVSYPRSQCWPYPPPEDIIESITVGTLDIDAIFTTLDGRRFVDFQDTILTFLEFEHTHGISVLDHLDQVLTQRVSDYRRAMSIAQAALPIQFEIQVMTENMECSTRRFFAYGEAPARQYLRKQKLVVMDIKTVETEFRQGEYRAKGTV